MKTSVSSRTNHLSWRELRSDIRATSRDAQPLEGKNRAFLSYLQGAAESSRTSITLACEHGHTRWKGSRCGPPFHLGDCSRVAEEVILKLALMGRVPPAGRARRPSLHRLTQHAPVEIMPRPSPT